ncbi:MAG: hypothetical protein K6B41_08565, partial [Butyrivibrio sp.]|nr:hypothetical protein [Butyrivibrio sp.]
ISYLADIYNQKIDAEKNILRLALYQSFFPKFMSGPIEKYERQKNDYLSLSSVHLFDANRLSTSFIYIITGYFMKLMVADRLALYVDKIFESYSILSSPLIVLGAVGYTIQIYFDFAGYSFTAIGIANLFGVNLISNFNNPYLAENIVDFWRRWHISLSTWLKDYIYIPLGGNRNGEIHKYINTMIVFTVCGFWHGSGLNFIAWGLLHGIFSVIENYMLKRNINFLFKGIIGRILNFILVGFAWIFFKASSLGHAIMYIKSMLTSFHADKTFSEQLEIIELPQLEINILLLSILAFFILEIISYRSKCTVPEYISDKKPVIKYGYLYLSLILILIYGIYGGLNTGTTFIYMQF